jgi:hypothetical protein
VQRPTCLRSMNVVAGAQASGVVDMRRRGVVKARVDTSKSLITRAIRVGRSGFGPRSPRG